TKLQAGGSVKVQADESATITAFATSVGAAVAATAPEDGFSLAMAGGASQAINTITNTIAACESGGADVEAGQDISILANDNAVATATVPTFEMAVTIDVGVAIGISLGSNTITDGVDAYIKGSTANAGRSVIFEAQ